MCFPVKALLIPLFYIIFQATKPSHFVQWARSFKRELSIFVKSRSILCYEYQSQFCNMVLLTPLPHHINNHFFDKTDKISTKFTISHCYPYPTGLSILNPANNFAFFYHITISNYVINLLSHFLHRFYVKVATNQAIMRKTTKVSS